MAVNVNLFPISVSSAMRARAKQKGYRYCGEGCSGNLNEHKVAEWFGRLLALFWDNFFDSLS